MDASLVAKWRERGNLPPADAELSVGPVWLAGTIEPLLESGPDRKRRASNVALVAVEDVERIDATRLADW